MCIFRQLVEQLGGGLRALSSEKSLWIFQVSVDILALLLQSDLNCFLGTHRCIKTKCEVEVTNFAKCINCILQPKRSHEYHLHN